MKEIPFRLFHVKGAHCSHARNTSQNQDASFTLVVPSVDCGCWPDTLPSGGNYFLEIVTRCQ